jgi:hypothetical protein
VSPRKPILVLPALCFAAAFGVACGGAPEDPAERIDEIRSGYSAKLNGFIVEQVPEAGMAEGMPMAEGAVEGAVQEEVGRGEGEGGEEAAPAEPEVAVRQDAILDILMSLDRRETLPGITVDVEHVGPKPEQAVKDTYRAYLDTSDIRQGGGTQLSYRLEDVDYETGDGFHVEVRSPIPPGERGEYRELQESGREPQKSGKGQP